MMRRTLRPCLSRPWILKAPSFSRRFSCSECVRVKGEAMRKFLSWFEREGVGIKRKGKESLYRVKNSRWGLIRNCWHYGKIHRKWEYSIASSHIWIGIEPSLTWLGQVWLSRMEPFRAHLRFGWVMGSG